MKIGKLAAVLLAAALIALFAAGCGGPGGDTDAGSGSAGESAGLVEYPIGEQNSKTIVAADGFAVRIEGVYHQPVALTPADGEPAAADADIHLKAIITAGENSMGYNKGDWIPYLTVDYRILPEGADSPAAKGTMRVINGTDGPRYGANVKLPDAGVYTVEFTITSPAANGVLVDTDEQTGVSGRFWKEPCKVTLEHWEYAGPVRL